MQARKPKKERKKKFKLNLNRLGAVVARVSAEGTATRAPADCTTVRVVRSINLASPDTLQCDGVDCQREIPLKCGRAQHKSQRGRGIWKDAAESAAASVGHWRGAWGAWMPMAAFGEKPQPAPRGKCRRALRTTCCERVDKICPSFSEPDGLIGPERVYTQLVGSTILTSFSACRLSFISPTSGSSQILCEKSVNATTTVQELCVSFVDRPKHIRQRRRPCR